jgi:hypothetical protein
MNENNKTWQRFDHWGSISSVTSKSGSDAVSGLSRSQRCFQATNPVGEQLYNQNYYSSSRNFTPGPGSYEGNYFCTSM